MWKIIINNLNLNNIIIKNDLIAKDLLIKKLQKSILHFENNKINLIKLKIKIKNK